MHPGTGVHLIYPACDVIAGTAHVAAASEPDAVEWVPPRNLGEYVPQGFYELVEAYFQQVLAAGALSPTPSKLPFPVHSKVILTRDGIVLSFVPSFHSVQPCELL